MPNQSQDYKKLKLLGQGTYGKAFLVERKSDGLKCVIKQIEMAHMTEEERKEAQKEANILQILNHHNIIKYHEQYKTKKGRLCIVMDYAEGGDLNQVITKAKSPIPEDQILNWLLQLSCALNFVHTKNIIHRDIKAQNIFLSANNIVKLADFGIARVLSCTKDKAQTFIGTPYYLAPELVDSKPYSTKADIWSLGVLIYHLCALKPPFEAESIPTLMLKISRGQFPSIPQFYSKELRSLVTEMLTVDPNQRPSALQILEKPLIKNRAMSFLSETIALQQQDVDQLTEKQNNQNIQQKQQQNQKEKKNHYNLQDNDRRYGFKEIQKNNVDNKNVVQTRFYSPQHNEQRGFNIGFNHNLQSNGIVNNGEKSSYNDLPIIGCDDFSNRPKTKNEALKYFKGQDEYYKQNQNQQPYVQGIQGNQDGKRQLNRVESLNEFPSNNNIGSNNNQNKNKNGLIKQPSIQPTQQDNHQQIQQKQQENQGSSNQNYPKKSFRVHSPVHHKMPSPSNRFNENKQLNNHGINHAHNPNSVNQNINHANENIHSNQDHQYFSNNNKLNNNYNPSSGQNMIKTPISNNYLLANNNQNNLIQPNSQNNKMEQQIQNNFNNNNIPSQQIRVGSPGTRLPHLNYQPPPAKVKHGQNFSLADNISTPQINQRRNLEKIQKPSILNNKNSDLSSPKNYQRPPSALIGFGNYNNLKNGIQNKNVNNQIGQINNQDCISPSSNNINKQYIFPNNQQQATEEVQKNPNNMRENLQSANPSSQQTKLNKMQQQPLPQYQIQQQNSQQQQVQSNQQQATKELQKSEESSEEDQYQQDSNNQKQYQQVQQNPSAQSQNQQKRFVIKKGAAQVFGLQIPQTSHINQIPSNQRVSSQPAEENFSQPPSYLVNFNTQPTSNIQLLSVESPDSSQRDTPKNGSENMTQATVNSFIVNTQQLKKSDFSLISATQASLYEATQATKPTNSQSQSGLDDIKSTKKAIQSIKSINSSDNIDHTDSQFKASSSTSSQNSQQKMIQSKNILQSVSKNEFSEIKGKRKESQSDEDIRIFDSVDSQKSVKTPTNVPPQSHFSSNGNNASNNQQIANKLAITEEIDSNKKPSPLFSSHVLNSDNDKETKVERKLIVKFPIPFQESQFKQKEKDKKKNKNTEISPEIKNENEEQETDLEKMLNELNQMLTGNYDEQIQNLYTNGFELDTIEDKDDDLDEEEFNGNNNFNNFGQSPSNNLGNNQKHVNFGAAYIPNNISCIVPTHQNKQNKLNQNGNNINNHSVASKALATSNTTHSEVLTNTEDRVLQLRQSLQKEIGTIHFSKVYKLAVASLSNLQQPLESSEFYQSLKIMFPSISHQEIQRYTTLFHTLVMLEQD